MKAIFISDAHLRKSSDERYIKMMDFLDDIQKGNIREKDGPQTNETDKKLIDDLYIAGDFFDYWFCTKKKINPEFKPVIDKLIELQKAGIRIHFNEGNHDFFIGEYFHDVLGMNVCEEIIQTKLDHLNVLVAHGDTTDSSNTRYLFLRKVLRSRLFYYFQRFVPAALRWKLAGITSTASKELTVEDGDVLVKKMNSYAFSKFHDGYDAIILGHSHVPGIRHYTIADKKKTFVTLGDWIRHYSYLYYEDDNFYLRYYRS
jgi:UDP-2,3-diacylglucosamine hydrolase